MDALDPRHGTEAGHEQHMRDDEEPCDACYDGKLRASRRRTKRKTMGHHYTRQMGAANVATIQRWRKHGATYDDIGELCGITSASQLHRLAYATPTTIVYERTWRRIHDNAHRWPVTAATITRRIQAMCAIGYSTRAIAAAAGVNNDTVLDARDQPREFMAKKVRNGIVRAYDDLHMTPATGANRYERAGITRCINAAAEKGWPGPLAFDDIDNPLEKHKRTDDRGRHYTDYDEVVVDRLLDLAPIRATAAEKEEAIRRWTAAGRSARQLALAHGWNDGRYGKGRDAA